MTDSIGQFEKKVKSDQNKYNKKKKFDSQGREGRKKRAGLGSLQKKSDTNEIFMMQDEQKMAKGGRAGYKMGAKCK